jgi:protein transport protein SEC61 subunit gamma-like protein
MEIIKKGQQIQVQLENKMRTVGKGKYGRILKMARKPDKEQYKKVIQICGAGIIIIGALGFTIFYLWNYLPPYIQSFFT